MSLILGDPIRLLALLILVGVVIFAVIILYVIYRGRMVTKQEDSMHKFLNDILADSMRRTGMDFSKFDRKEETEREEEAIKKMEEFFAKAPVRGTQYYLDTRRSGENILKSKKEYLEVLKKSETSVEANLSAILVTFTRVMEDFSRFREDPNLQEKLLPLKDKFSQISDEDSLNLHEFKDLFSQIPDPPAEIIQMLKRWPGTAGFREEVLETVKMRQENKLLIEGLQGNLARVQELINRGFDRCQKSANGKDNLMGFAVLSGNVEVVRFLLQTGIHVDDSIDDQGTTPLTIAVMFCEMSMIRFLLEQGASVTAGSGSGDTSLAIAKRFREPSVQELLKAHESQRGV
jgi:hypothetical protein